MDDRALIHACQQGDETAWQLLYARHQPRLWGYFRTLTQNDPAADFEELCQETWLQVVRSLPAYEARLDGDAAFFPWLAVLARHRLLAEHRRNAARVQTVFGLPDPNEQIDVSNTAVSRVFARALLQQLPDPLDQKSLV
jgi:RNA polymerase sigma-70 factor, ECF subfamily